METLEFRGFRCFLIKSKCEIERENIKIWIKLKEMHTLMYFEVRGDTKESGHQEREKEWTGGTESYSLTEKNGVTTLIVKIDVPLELEETFNIRFPRALECVKALAEKMQ